MTKRYNYNETKDRIEIIDYTKFIQVIQEGTPIFQIDHIGKPFKTLKRARIWFIRHLIHYWSIKIKDLKD